jgi:adenine/guanine phosphoribosyltransferase-like PRPP-binding protein
MALDIDGDPQYPHVQKLNKEFQDERKYQIMDSSPSFTKKLLNNFVENAKDDKLALIGGISAFGLAAASAITATVGAPLILPAVVGTLVLSSLFMEKEKEILDPKDDTENSPTKS